MGAFLTVLAGFFKFYDDVKLFIEFRKQYSDEKWIAEGKDLTKAIQGAKTDEERKELVQRLSRHSSSA